MAASNGSCGTIISTFKCSELALVVIVVDGFITGSAITSASQSLLGKRELCAVLSQMSGSGVFVLLESS